MNGPALALNDLDMDFQLKEERLSPLEMVFGRARRSISASGRSGFSLFEIAESFPRRVIRSREAGPSGKRSRPSEVLCRTPDVLSLALS
jgi:hypothetical protein